MSEERLQKILARAGVASRRKAEELIREGHVTVNGQVAAIGDKADLERDSVKLDERRIHAPAGHRYLLLNKPRAVMSTVSDPAGRTTVIDLVPPAMRRALAPVGRLDYQTEGLLLLTDDGDLAQHVAHPSFGCWKTYEVKVRGRPAAEQLDRLRAGVVLEGRRTAPCRIAALRWASRAAPAAIRAGKAAMRAGGGRRGAVESTSSWWSVELGEGRSRQIREMFQRIGHPVQKLRRIAIGPVADPNLPVGSLRELTEREVAALRKAGPPPPLRIPRQPPRAGGAEKAARAAAEVASGEGEVAGGAAARSPRPAPAPRSRRPAASTKPRRRGARGARPATPGGKRARAAAARGPVAAPPERQSATGNRRGPVAAGGRGAGKGRTGGVRPGASDGGTARGRAGASRPRPSAGRADKGLAGRRGGPSSPSARPGRAGARPPSRRPGRPAPRPSRPRRGRG